jgi:hypothetical protein
MEIIFGSIVELMLMPTSTTYNTNIYADRAADLHEAGSGTDTVDDVVFDNCSRTQANASPGVPIRSPPQDYRYA